MRKHLTKILFTLTMVIGLSMTISAQKQDDKDKDKPPRRDPPKIVVPKPPKPPKDDNKDKKPKPEFYSNFIVVKHRSDLS